MKFLILAIVIAVSGAGLLVQVFNIIFFNTKIFNYLILLIQKGKLNRNDILDCISRQGVTESEVMPLNMTNMPNASKEKKCFFKCLLEKMEVVKNGGLQERIIGPKSITDKEILENCSLKFSNDCNGVSEWFDCFIKENLSVEVASLNAMAEN